MILTPENIKKHFPKQSAQVLKTFVECKAYINKYAIDNNLSPKDISDIAQDIINKKHYYNYKHSEVICNVIVDKICKLSNYTRPHGEFVFYTLDTILEGNDHLIIPQRCIHQMLLEYYIPNLSYNNWKAYITN